MYGAALSLSVATTAGTVGIPFFQLGSLNVGIPIQAFGVIVATGVLIGAALLRRYAEWHGVADDHIRGLTGWITVTGFLGAHLFDVLAYQWDKLQDDPVLLVKVWDGISSYGGFIGGALGFAIYVWWKRLPARLMADIALVGLLPAFSIGRIGCAVVSDHIGAFVDADKWYAPLAMEYPRNLNNEVVHQLVVKHPAAGEYLHAWNLGLLEFLYLVPVNALLLFLAFRASKKSGDTWIGRYPAGLIAVLTGLLYAPVRFFMDYLRPESSDPTHAGLTFAQWASLLAFAAAIYLATKLVQSGKPAETITRTSREAQERLRVILKDDDDAKTASSDKSKGGSKMSPARPASQPARRGDDVDDDDDDDDDDEPVKTTDKTKATDADKPQNAKTEYTAAKPNEASSNWEQPADEGAAVDQEEIASAAKPAPKPANKPGGGGGGNKNKNKKKKKR
ncbi:MAG TPA: prolipoprotein diacylglyceryl transferase family protein [Kofleriaceae bacterium]|nr:prolipoprotein diacylglyceryl transferase family protein [Kofleriaceae bacterium]